MKDTIYRFKDIFVYDKITDHKMIIIIKIFLKLNRIKLTSILKN
jgi:hypothetical protein